MARTATVVTPDAPETNGTGPILEDGFMFLSDLKSKRKPANDEYATLRPFVGKHIVLDFSKMTFTPVTKTVKRKGVEKEVQGIEGSAQIYVKGENADQLTAISLPLGSIRTLYDASQSHPDVKFVALVRQTKRGIALG